MTFFYKIVVAILICFPSFIIAQNNLGYKLEKGTVFTIEQTANQHILQELESGNHELENNSSGILEFTVIDSKDDFISLEMKFKQLFFKIESDQQGEILNVDTMKADQSGMESEIFRSLLDKPILLSLSANTGKITEIIGGDSLVIGMIKATGVTDDATIKLLKTTFEKEFGSKALINSYEQLTYIYPDHKVTIGDQWQNEFLGKLTSKNDWTLNVRTKDSIEISGISDVEMKFADQNLSMNLKGSQKSTIIADSNNGFLINMEVIGVFKGNSTMIANEKIIPTTIKQTVTYKLITIE